MRKRSPIIPLFFISLLAWVTTISYVVQYHATQENADSLSEFSSDVTFSGEERSYFSVYRNDQKVGYRSVSLIRQPRITLVSEETVLKMNLAGVSREVFMLSVSAIDSVTNVTRQMTYSLGTGSHSYTFDGTLSADSLTIKVKKNSLDPERTGTFLVNEFTTTPSALSYFISHTNTSISSYQIFDPVIFADYLLHATKNDDSEIRTIDGTPQNLRKTDFAYNDTYGAFFFDSNGNLIHVDDFPLFGGYAGSFTLERAYGDTVFMLPLEVSFGMDILHNIEIKPHAVLANPRSTQLLTVELNGIRAANIDVDDPVKEMLSANPVQFRIHVESVAANEHLSFIRELAKADTSLTGGSDYIQPYDARMKRAAESAAGALTDTLAIAHAIGNWVTDTMDYVPNLDIARSIDILREQKGGCDEYTKLFTAMTRSLGIPTQIHMGLVYRDDAFRYHSWPAVFINGTWYSLDPFFGQNQADATHITLVSGDFERLVDLIRIVGPLSITVRDAR